MIDEGARPAVVADLEVLAALYEVAAAEKREQRGGDLWLRHRGRSAPYADSFADDLDDAAHPGDARPLVVVGTLDDVVVGFGTVGVDALDDDRRLAVIHDLFVLPEARALGVGEAMIGLLLDHSRTAGCMGIDSVAMPGDRNTKNFFETFGLVARAIVVHQSFGAPESGADPGTRLDGDGAAARPEGDRQP